MAAQHESDLAKISEDVQRTVQPAVRLNLQTVKEVSSSYEEG